jgi:hypothetical protein
VPRIEDEAHASFVHDTPEGGPDGQGVAVGRAPSLVRAVDLGRDHGRGRLATSPGVSCVLTPFGEPLGTGCPEQPADQGGGGEAGEQPQLSPEAQGALSER